MKISGYVIFLHLVLVWALIFYNVAEKKISLTPRIQVKEWVQKIDEMVHLKQQEPTPIAVKEEEPEAEIQKPIVEEIEQIAEPVEKVAEVKPVKKIEPVKPKPKVVTKTVSKPKTTTKPKTTPKAKPAKPKKAVVKAAPKKTQNDKLAALMQDALKSLDSSSSKGSTTPKSKGIPSKKIETLSSEALKFELTYQDKLVALLEDILEFPEKGDLKIKLTLKKNGSLENVDILSGGSEKNRRYLRDMIPKITFPAFDVSLKQKDKESFFIVLTSEKH